VLLSQRCMVRGAAPCVGVSCKGRCVNTCGWGLTERDRRTSVDVFFCCYCSVSGIKWRARNAG